MSYIYMTQKVPRSRDRRATRLAAGLLEPIGRPGQRSASRFRKLRVPVDVRQYRHIILPYSIIVSSIMLYYIHNISVLCIHIYIYIERERDSVRY